MVVDDTTGKKCYARFGDKDKQCMNDCIIERLILKENTVKDITRKIITKDKQEKIFQVTATPYIVDDAIAGMIVILNDITDQDYLRIPTGSIPESTASMRIYDEITCAYSKDYFFERLQSEFFISQRYATPLSLCILEADDFDSKKIDFGQQYTISVIQQIVDLLKERLRRSDLIFLFSESQISVLLPYTNVTAALHLSSEIKSSIQNRFLHGKEILTASIGVAEASRHMKNFSELIEMAMKSIKEARISGNTVVCSQHR
jgi:diguanylate cyclase (GGDEF)-like protein